jgi:hypothetical protein
MCELFTVSLCGFKNSVIASLVAHGDNKISYGDDVVRSTLDCMECFMTIKGNIKEAAGFVKEEIGEKLNDDKMANEGRALRNEGRMEDGKLPKLTKPGTTEPKH